MTRTIEKTLSRAAAAGSSTLDADARTVQVTFATETVVRRHSWEIGPYDEILDCTPAAIDAGRMSSMSLLDSHRTGSLADRVGTVVPGSLKFDLGSVSCTIKFSRTEKAEALLSDLVDGHTLPVSVGYRIHEEQRTEAPSGGVTVVRATRWEPLEISLVTIPADAGAKTRSLEEGNTQMTTTQTRSNEQRTDTINERTRISQIRTVARMTSLSEDVVDAAINDGISVDAFRSEALSSMVERQNRPPTFPHRSNEDDRNHVRADVMADALYLRVDPSHKPQDQAHQFVGLSLPELARRCLEARGENTVGSSPSSLVTRALHTTSDFSAILSNLAEKRLKTEFAQVPAALKRVARQSSARDFKAKTSVRLSAAPDLKKVNEHGEFTRGTMLEDAESYRIETFGRIFGITRQALINDDLGAFDGAARKFSQAAAAFEAKFLAVLVEANGMMSDGKAVFHAAHGNLMTGTALNLDALAAGRLKFRQQIGLAGDLVDLTPRFLIVPASLETAGEKLLSEINAAKTDDSNVFARRLELVVEPRLTDPKAWYLAADPAACEGLEFAYLDGHNGPEIETRVGFDVDSVETKVRLDFGGAFVEHRGWLKNPGV